MGHGRVTEKFQQRYIYFLSNEGMLEHESLSESLDDVDLRKDNLTLPSEYWVIFCNSVFGSSCFGITGAVAPSRIHLSGRLTSFYWIGFGITVWILLMRMEPPFLMNSIVQFRMLLLPWFNSPIQTVMDETFKENIWLVLVLTSEYWVTFCNSVF